MSDTTTLQKALLAIRKLKNAVQNLEYTSFVPMAIVGLACRFPLANNKDEYWELLTQGKNVITKIPDERWNLLAQSEETMLRDNNHAYWGGYLKEISAFDAYFFGISPREAMRMDPQQRLLLELAYESLEDAGYSIESIAGTNCGVFVGLYSSQLAQLQSVDDDMDALFIPSGNAPSIAANRISYQFDLHGPSMVIDTSCSSSLVALHTACMNIKNKQCDMALVGGVNINLLPHINSVLAKAKMLSPDGQCHTFDADANGYVPGEGVGFVMIKSLAAALRDKDKIYATIRGSAVNQDGRTNGLTAPNGLLQEEVLQAAYKSAKINPQEVAFVECHGTGTFLGDPIEVQALGNIVGKQRTAAQLCYLGSVKANIGHLEPAAGIASIIKAALCLQKGVIPRQLNFSKPNPHIAFRDYQFQIPIDTVPFPQYGEQRLAGVSGFGFGGTNAHLILGDASTLDATEETQTSGITSTITNEVAKDTTTSGDLFTLSAKDSSSLKILIQRWCQYLGENPQIDFDQLCYNTHVKRSHHATRIAIYAQSVSELYDRLRNLQDNFYIQSPYIYIKSAAQNKDINTNLRQSQILSNQWQEAFARLVAMKIISQTKLTLAELFIEKLGIENTVKTVSLLNKLNTDDLDQVGLYLLGFLYVNDVKIAWHVFEENRSYKTLDLPSYPWQHKSYWPPLKNTIESTLEATSEHPFNGKQVLSPLSQSQFEFSYSTKKIPEIADTFNVLHAGFYLEMLTFAVAQIQQKNLFTIDDLQFLSPFLVDNTSNIKVQLVINKQDQDSYAFSFYSNSHKNNNWIKNATGLLSFSVEKKLPIDSVETIKSRCQTSHDANYFYQKITQMNMPSGNSIRWTQQFWASNQDEILCEFQAPQLLRPNEQFCLGHHPGIIDGCIQAVFMALPDDFVKPYVASQIKHLTFHSIATGQLYLYAKLKTIMGTGEQVIGDWYLIDTLGTVFIACEDLTLTQYDNKININSLMQASSVIEFSPTDTLEVRKNKIQTFLLEQASLIFSMPPSDINSEIPLRDLGIDSLMALVLSRAIETTFKYSCSVQDILQGLSLAEIVELIKEAQPTSSVLAPTPIINKEILSTTTSSPISAKNPWIPHYKKNTAAKVRLFCLPFGGGGASIYQQWQDYLPNSIQVCPIQLPGREERMNETPISDINTMIHLIIENIQAEMDIPFALLGHSFGALIAFELARYCDKYKLKLPLHLFASAYPDPRTPTKGLDSLLQQLAAKGIELFSLAKTKALDSFTDQQFADLITAFNQNGLLDYADPRLTREIIKLVIPTFIADMSLVKNYQYYSANPFEFPLTVFIGKQDTWVLPEDHRGWKDHTTANCDFIEFESGHLFIKDKPTAQQMCKTIIAALNL